MAHSQVPAELGTDFQDNRERPRWWFPGLAQSVLEGELWLSISQGQPRVCTECWVTHFTSCMEGFGTAPLLGVHFLSEEMPTISLKWPSFTGPRAWAGGSQGIHNFWISANQNLKSGITCQTSCQSQRQLLSPKANNQASLCHLSSLRVCLNPAPAPCQLPEALEEFYPLKMVTHVSSRAYKTTKKVACNT